MEKLQAGFTNSAKKLDMLKQGGKLISRLTHLVDYKNVIIHVNESTKLFEKAMKMKILILASLFFSRHQEGSDSHENFFEFAKKFLAKQKGEFALEKSM